MERSTSANPASPSRRADPARAKEDELVQARQRIKALEKQLEQRTEELDLLKKAQRFFEKEKR